jgi:nitric oxide reductase subunit C
MTKSTTRSFFFVATLFFAALFILLTIHTHTTIAARTHEEGLTETVRHGEHVWEKYNCENCHTLLGEGAYYAPDLTQIVSQRGPTYLTQFLADPSKFYSETRDGRLMPTLGLLPDEIADVIAFLDWVGHIDTNGWPPRPILVSGVSSRGLPGVAGVATSEEASSRGKALFNGSGACVTCHSVESGVDLVGPSLTAIAIHADRRIHDSQYKGAAKTAEEYLEESIVKPNAFLVAGRAYSTRSGVSLMPDTYGKTLTAEEVKDLVAYLKTLQ